LVELIQTRLPQLKVEYRDSSFAGDMRSIHVSFDKMRTLLQFEAEISLEQGVEELLWTLRDGVIADPLSERFRNHPAILV